MQNNNNKARNLAKIGLLLSSKEKYEVSIIFFEKALELETNSKYFCLLGNVYANQGLHDKAIQTYQECIKLNQNDKETLNNIGTVFLEKKEFKEAKNWFQNSIKIYGEDYITCFNIAKLFEEQKKYEKAKKQYFLTLNLIKLKKESKILKNKDTYNLINQESDIYNNLGICEYNLNNLKISKNYFEKSIKLNSNSYQPYQNLANYYLKKQNYIKAEFNYSILIKLNPKKGLEILGNIYIEQKKFQESSICFEKLIKLEYENKKTLQIFKKSYKKYHSRENENENENQNQDSFNSNKKRKKNFV